MSVLDVLVSSFILIFLVSLDVMAMGFSYGVDGTRVSLPRLVLISAIGNALLAASLFLGYITLAYISDSAIQWTAFILFTLAGSFKLITWWVSSKKTGVVYSPRKKTPTIPETMFIAILLAIDGIGVGFAVGIGNPSIGFIIAVIATSFVVDILLFKFGEWLSRFLPARKTRNLGWIAGTLLIAIGVLQVVI